ncbi:hypothetical protein GCM10010446_58650 [Streptomyces enissocaesilis]|uniref:Uncharacterized protein n=1 Tax=Streptomyces enissocaesilis TaxID=332589 RepID=A0ABP6K352_9ACTN
MPAWDAPNMAPWSTVAVRGAYTAPGRLVRTVDAVRDAERTRDAVGCPGTADGEERGGHEQRGGGVREGRRETDQGGAEDERRLVERSLERQDGADEPFVGTAPAGERDRSRTRHRADLGNARSGERADERERERTDAAEGGDHESGDGDRVDEGGGQDDGALSVTVRHPAQQRPAGRPARRERAADQACRGEAAAGLGDQQAAGLTHGGRQPAEERHAGSTGPVRETTSRYVCRVPGIGRT